MDEKHFYIKNMVCSHCAEVLEEKLTSAGFKVQKLNSESCTSENRLMSQNTVGWCL